MYRSTGCLKQLRYKAMTKYANTRECENAFVKRTDGNRNNMVKSKQNLI